MGRASGSAWSDRVGRGRRNEGDRPGRCGTFEIMNQPQGTTATTKRLAEAAQSEDGTGSLACAAAARRGAAAKATKRRRGTNRRAERAAAAALTERRPSCRTPLWCQANGWFAGGLAGGGSAACRGRADRRELWRRGGWWHCCRQLWLGGRLIRRRSGDAPLGRRDPDPAAVCLAALQQLSPQVAPGVVAAAARRRRRRSAQRRAPMRAQWRSAAAVTLLCGGGVSHQAPRRAAAALAARLGGGARRGCSAAGRADAGGQDQPGELAVDWQAALVFICSAGEDSLRVAPQPGSNMPVAESHLGSSDSGRVQAPPPPPPATAAPQAATGRCRGTVRWCELNRCADVAPRQYRTAVLPCRTFRTLQVQVQVDVVQQAPRLQGRCQLPQASRLARAAARHGSQYQRPCGEEGETAALKPGTRVGTRDYVERKRQGKHEGWRALAARGRACAGAGRAGVLPRLSQGCRAGTSAGREISRPRRPPPAVCMPSALAATTRQCPGIGCRLLVAPRQRAPTWLWMMPICALTVLYRCCAVRRGGGASPERAALPRSSTAYRDG